MPVQTPTLVKGTPRRSPSIEFRESPLRSASRAKPTTSWDHHSTNTTPELPTLDPTELRKKLSLLLVDKFGEDFVPRPVQIEARAGLFQLERFETRIQYDAVFVIAPTGSEKSLIFQQAMYQHQVGFIRLAVEATPVLSPTVLIPLQADNLNQERKKAVVICKETWGDGELYRQLSDPSHTVSLIFIMHNGDKRWAELISKDSFRERVKLLAYDEAIKIADGVSLLGCQTLFLTAGAPPYEINKILKVSSLSESRTFFAKADLFRPNLNIAVEMKPRTNGTMGSIRDLLNQRSDPSIFPQSIMYFNSQEATKRLSWVQLLLRSFSL
ncbi:BZ3500_MvSof-1268-A1-R1_Chr5-2g07770 [Microbotryum saponariae]|uniref:BZ3500_MvSof-1268-A1-R1_Chr5-2g07770 protein n=1 Tax=Microbotryum saponariae TaxID=289078 RepID=A0A2X0KGF5_9BASI|nr:BZ3500_MvSof-1268-A1-R1_Chr5-2g07770 [Microbotryum saponariae]SDA05639.1 BZ3501_MvSof-1269-A2-R1_Chr5-2g07592 [Microbotryum saponariae]